MVVVVEGRVGSPNAERRKCDIFGRGENGIFHLMPKAIALVMPRTSWSEQVRVVYVSNVIYQKLYQVRLIYISGFLSN